MATSPALAWAALLVVLVVPAASAHGALQPREIDTRVLLDNDGGLGPATCVDQVAQTCDARPKGLDLLSLDAREAFWTDPAGPITVGTKVVHFLVAVQDHIGAGDQAVELHVTAAGKPLTFGFESEGANYTSKTCTAFSGPFPVAGGDGDQQAFDCTVSYGALGVNGTGALTGIVVHSEVGGADFDEMPGTWFLNGQEVPFVPDSDAPTEMGSTTPGNYTLAGPAHLANVTLSANRVDLRNGKASVDVEVKSALGRMDQVATLNMSAPASVQASLSAATLSVRNGTTAKAHIDVVGATRDSTITLVVSTDLGAYETLTLAVAAPPPPPPRCGAGAGNATATGASCTGTSSSSTSKASGAPESVFVAGLLAALAAVRRRR